MLHLLHAASASCVLVACAPRVLPILACRIAHPEVLCPAAPLCARSPRGALQRVVRAGVRWFEAPASCSSLSEACPFSRETPLAGRSGRLLFARRASTPPRPKTSPTSDSGSRSELAQALVRRDASCGNTAGGLGDERCKESWEPFAGLRAAPARLLACSLLAGEARDLPCPALRHDAILSAPLPFQLGPTRTHALPVLSCRDPLVFRPDQPAP